MDSSLKRRWGVFGARAILGDIRCAFERCRDTEKRWRLWLGLSAACTWSDLKASSGRSLPGLLIRAAVYLLVMVCVALWGLVLQCVRLGDVLDLKLGASDTMRACYDPVRDAIRSWARASGEDDRGQQDSA